MTLIYARDLFPEVRRAMENFQFEMARRRSSPAPNCRLTGLAASAQLAAWQLRRLRSEINLSAHLRGADGEEAFEDFPPRAE